MGDKPANPVRGVGYPLFVRSDLDGFFGLFVDNLVQLLLIVGLCSGLCGMRSDDSYFLFAHILPGAAVSLLLGNIFYAWQAHRLARREARSDVTALPYGINTPSLLVYVYFVMLPVYRDTGSAKLAWQMGLVACLGSGVIELLGAFVADWVRRHTPRAALLASLAGIAIGFISMSFALQMWQAPLVAMLPLAIILITYFAKVRLVVPGGLLAVVAGTLLAWVLPGESGGAELSFAALGEAWQTSDLALPKFSGHDILEVLANGAGGMQALGFLSVIVPMGLFNVAGSLQNIESAEAAGDRYPTRQSLAANGIGTIAAALFGSCFPTTIYIGHPGWKEMGARAGYSSLNGVVATVICFTGTLGVISKLIPIEACIAIVLWIGVIITAQAFQATPRQHAPAVAMGLFPAIAGWGAAVAAGTFALIAQSSSEAALSMQALFETRGLGVQTSGFLLHAMNIMSQGYILTSMVLAAMAASLIDRSFRAASLWAFMAAILSWVGLIHAYQLSGNVMSFLFVGMEPHAGALGFPANNIAMGYLLMSLCFAGAGLVYRSGYRATPDLAA